MGNRHLDKRWVCLLAALICVGLLSGCAQDAAKTNPSPVPDGQPELSPVADVTMAEQMTVPLYFRVQGENLLARETRTLRIPNDRRAEVVLIEALIDGPSASLLDLTGVFHPATRVAVSAEDEVLTVTLSRDFFATPSDAPSDWASDEAWRAEVLLRRRLALVSIVNAVTECMDYTAVQFMVRQDSDADSPGARVALSDFYEDVDDPNALLGPVTRDESVLLTHHNTAQAIVEAWQTRDFERMYRFVAQMDGQRPTETEFLLLMSTLPGTLTGCTISPGVVSTDGHGAVLSLDIVRENEGERWQTDNYPLRLTLENGLWKISYPTLLRMMEETQ